MVREPWPSPLRDNLPALLERHAGQDVVALASGDPLVSGIGSTLIALLGEGAVRIEPALSSVALARARMGWSSEASAVVTVVGRDLHAVLRELAPGWRVRRALLRREHARRAGARCSSSRGTATAG